MLSQTRTAGEFYHAFEQRCTGALVLTFMIVGSAASAAPQAESAWEPLDRVVAVIDDEIITKRELEARAGAFMANLGDLDNAEARAKERRKVLTKVLDIVIGERMIKAEIERSRSVLGVVDADIDRAIDEVRRMNNLSTDQLKAALYGQGLGWEEYRDQLRGQIERARLIRARVQGRIQVSDADALARCKLRQRDGAKDVKVCAAHILLALAPGASDDEVSAITSRASRLRSELRRGADFSAYALEHSDDRGSPDGDLGCFGRGEMVAAFETAAFSTNVGEISKPVRSEFGIHLIHVKERRSPAKRACDANDEATMRQFREELYQQGMESAMKAWIAELRASRFVEIRL